MEVDYFFEFTTEAGAANDPIVGPLLLPPNLARPNIWAYDVAPLLTAPYSPVAQTAWCMVAQFGVANSALTTHPNLKFFLVTPGPVLTEALGNGKFMTLSRAKALYAQNWSFGGGGGVIPGAMQVDLSNNAMVDVSGNAMIQ